MRFGATKWLALFEFLESYSGSHNTNTMPIKFFNQKLGFLIYCISDFVFWKQKFITEVNQKHPNRNCITDHLNIFKNQFWNEFLRNFSVGNWAAKTNQSYSILLIDKQIQINKEERYIDGIFNFTYNFNLVGTIGTVI